MPSANPQARFQIADVMEGHEAMTAEQIAALADLTNHGASSCLEGMWRRGEVKKIRTAPGRFAYRFVRRPIETAARIQMERMARMVAM